MSTPAFPETLDHDGRPLCEPGMDLRDYFAARAMQAMISGRTLWDNQIIAQNAYALADRMIQERQK